MKPMNPVEAYDSALSDGMAFRIFLKKAGYKGVGVFAGKIFQKGEIIEMCHAFIYEWQSKYQRDAAVARYAYGVGCHCNPSPSKPPCLLNCPMNGGRYIMPTGFGACYNSADREEDANARYEVIADKPAIIYIASKDISEGDEIVTWFGKGYYDSWCKPFIPKKK